jgi:hypothetical protein
VLHDQREQSPCRTSPTDLRSQLGCPGTGGQRSAASSAATRTTRGPTCLRPRHARPPTATPSAPPVLIDHPGTPGPRPGFSRFPVTTTRDRQGGRTSSDRGQRRDRQACRGLPCGEGEKSHHAKTSTPTPGPTRHPSTHPQLGRALNIRSRRSAARCVGVVTRPCSGGSRQVL